MHQYRFVGQAETVLTGLIHGVNAFLHRDEHGQPDESTVVVQPDDLVTTVDPYPHAHLVNVETGEPDTEPDASPRPEPQSLPEGTPTPVPLTPEGEQTEATEPPAARRRRGSSTKTEEVSQ